MLEVRSTDRITVAGLPGTGKTTLAKFLASLCEPRVLIYDPLAQYDQFPEECRYVPKTDTASEFEALCRKLRAQGNITFIVEEAERYLGQQRMLGDNAFDLINRGRNWGVGIFAITRRIQTLNKQFFDLCHKVMLFKCGLRSRGYIADMIGNELTNKVMQLPRYHFLYYDVETEQSSMSVLKLGGARADLVTKEEEEAKKVEEASIKEGKIEELKPEAKEGENGRSDIRTSESQKENKPA